MKYLSFALFLGMFACSSPKQKTTMKEDSTATPSQIVGGDRDAHGCIGSAGYQFSELKNDCVRPFELPLQLENKDKSFMAGVVFSEDASKAEVFSKEGHFVLNVDAAKNYHFEKYSLIKENNKWIFMLTADGDVYYTEK